ncbi:MAG: hypothetical protein SGCHY_003257 [Lobulomycetales sp.]
MLDILTASGRVKHIFHNRSPKDRKELLVQFDAPGITVPKTLHTFTEPRAGDPCVVSISAGDSSQAIIQVCRDAATQTLRPVQHAAVQSKSTSTSTSMTAPVPEASTAPAACSSSQTTSPQVVIHNHQNYTPRLNPPTSTRSGRHRRHRRHTLSPDSSDSDHQQYYANEASGYAMANPVVLPAPERSLTTATYTSVSEMVKKAAILERLNRGS